VGSDRNIWQPHADARQISALLSLLTLRTNENLLSRATYSVIKVRFTCEPPADSMRTPGSRAACQASSVPSRLRLGLAPTCSTRWRHSSPR